MKAFRNFKLTIIALMMVAGMSMSSATPVAASTELGGVSVNWACEEQYPGTSATLLYNNVNGWRCVTYWSGGPAYFANIDLDKQCRLEYSDSGAWAAWSDYNDPYSWRCFT